MKFLILSENSNGTWPFLHFRGLGSFELTRRIAAAGHTATVVDWFTHWSIDELKESAEIWFGDNADPVIAISTPFNTTDVYYLQPFLEWAKNKWPQLVVIHGGGRVFDATVKNIDVFFLGRSMQIFDDWLHKRDISRYTVNTQPLVLKNLDFNQYIDIPVVPVVHDDDFYTEDDILGFEIGVGCKFNCTFCNYELRGAKIAKLTDSKSLHKFFYDSYNKYGIVNFFIADDTPNENDIKLKILADSLEGLNFHPRITGFTRLDILAARPSQLEYYKRIQFDSLFFGIESFNEKASKGIRKKSDLFNVYDTLKKLREISPTTFLVGGLIVGLNGDSEQSIVDSVERVINERLLDSIQLYPLLLLQSQNAIIGEGYMSDLEADPERFGYKLAGGTVPTVLSGDLVHKIKWISDWTDFESAEALAVKLSNNISKRISDLNHMEYAGLRTLGLVSKDDPDFHLSISIIRSRSYSKSTRLKKEYISKKLNYFRNLNGRQ